MTSAVQNNGLGFVPVPLPNNAAGEEVFAAEENAEAGAGARSSFEMVESGAGSASSQVSGAMADARISVPDLQAELGRIWNETKPGEIDFRGANFDDDYSPERFERLTKIAEALVDARAKELGVDKSEVTVSVCGCNSNDYEVEAWITTGATIYVVEAGDAASSGLELMEMELLEKYPNSETVQRITYINADETDPPKSQIVIWIHPTPMMRSKVDIWKNVEEDGILIVQTDNEMIVQSLVPFIARRRLLIEKYFEDGPLAPSMFWGLCDHHRADRVWIVRNRPPAANDVDRSTAFHPSLAPFAINALGGMIESVNTLLGTNLSEMELLVAALLGSGLAFAGSLLAYGLGLQREAKKKTSVVPPHVTPQVLPPIIPPRTAPVATDTIDLALGGEGSISLGEVEAVVSKGVLPKGKYVGVMTVENVAGARAYSLRSGDGIVLIPPEQVVTLGRRGDARNAKLNRLFINVEFPQFVQGSFNESLGGKWVIVDFREKVVARFLKTHMASLKEGLRSGRLSPAEAAREAWAKVREHVFYDRERVKRKGSVPEDVYTLGQFISKGVCNERGQILQVALQYIGINSRMEKGLYDGVRHAWVRVVDPVAGEMILDPQFPTVITPEMPEFSYYVDDGTPFVHDRLKTGTMAAI